MGPYYRATSQGTGAFFDFFYEHPILMFSFVILAVGIAVYLFRRIKTGG